MRDPHDDVTATVPGVPELPAPVRRVKVADLRERAGYRGPRDVESCRRCRHETAGRCEAHGFSVQAGAVCASWATR